ncbi:phage integrase central domain-containing protein [Bordetella petrii]|uniref:tyrosine-type recombinase/integrase n=1 Tax=Bordetella petrii TaxID=94624 RepID=UPI001A97BFDD|nr:hypothetical protein [Bordetella petrii]
MARIENDVFPWTDKRPITEIDASEILAVLKRVDGRGARHTAHKIRSKISMVFRYGIKEGHCKTDPAKVGKMLRAFEGFSGTFIVQCARRLAPMLFVRRGEPRQAEWGHIDLGKAEWRYTVSKTGTAHLVSLARQAVNVLRQLHALTGHGRYVFPGARSYDRPMSHGGT